VTVSFKPASCFTPQELEEDEMRVQARKRIERPMLSSYLYRTAQSICCSWGWCCKWQRPLHLIDGAMTSSYTTGWMHEVVVDVSNTINCLGPHYGQHGHNLDGQRMCSCDCHRQVDDGSFIQASRDGQACVEEKGRLRNEWAYLVVVVVVDGLRYLGGDAGNSVVVVGILRCSSPVSAESSRSCRLKGCSGGGRIDNRNPSEDGWDEEEEEEEEEER